MIYQCMSLFHIEQFKRYAKTCWRNARFSEDSERKSSSADAPVLMCRLVGIRRIVEEI
jgi:hypothetical protein